MKLICQECSMPCDAREYHPFAACLMFKACHDSATVRASLQAVMNDGAALDAKRLDAANERIATLQASLDQLHGSKFSDRTYAALVDRAERNEADAAIGRAVMSSAIIFDGSVEGMTVLTLAADCTNGALEDVVRNSLGGIAIKEQAG